MGQGPFHCGSYHPWANGPGFYKKTSNFFYWNLNDEQVIESKPVKGTPAPHLASELSFVSRSLPCMISCPNCFWWWTVIWTCKLNKPFPPASCFWPGHSITALVTLAKASTKVIYKEKQIQTTLRFHVIPWSTFFNETNNNKKWQILRGKGWNANGCSCYRSHYGG